MNWVDAVVIAVLLVSALLAAARGFVREMLGVAAWVGAGYVTYRARPVVEPHVLQWIKEPDIAIPLGSIIVFLVALIVFSVIAGWLARHVRRSAAGGLDRTLGLLFGLARGAALVVAAYIVAQLVLPIERWPDPVLQSRSIRFAYHGAKWAVSKIPEDFSPPHLVPPPQAPQARASDLLQAKPEGHALPERTAPANPPAGGEPRGQESH
jgi:membrane protein required for colicin V production